MATAASTRIKPLGAAIIIAGVTIFCVAVFKYGIGVPYDLLNRRFLP